MATRERANERAKGLTGRQTGDDKCAVAAKLEKGEEEEEREGYARHSLLGRG